MKNNVCKKISNDREVSRCCRVEANLNRSTSYRAAIEYLEEILINPPSCQEGVKIVIRKSLEARQIARCRGGVELAFKISFSRKKKNTDINAIKHATQPMIQTPS